MTNYEKYKDEIKSAIERSIPYTYLLGKVPGMADADTDFVAFMKAFTWLMDEYEEPEVDWSKVPVDTKVLVKDAWGNWYKKYFAKFEDGEPYVYVNGATSFSAREDEISAAYEEIMLYDESGE